MDLQTVYYWVSIVFMLILIAVFVGIGIAMWRIYVVVRHIKETATDVQNKVQAALNLKKASTVLGSIKKIFKRGSRGR